MAHYDANGDDSVTWKEYLQKEHDYTLVKLETDRAKDDVDLAQTLQVGGATRGQRVETSNTFERRKYARGSCNVVWTAINMLRGYCALLM